MLILLVTWLCQTLLLSSSATAQGTLPCQFPFIHGGVTYSSCTTTGNPWGNLWCSTKTDSQNNHISGGGHYRDCTVDEHIQQQLLSGTKSSGTLPCQFPFIYKSVTYTSCTRTGDPDGNLWCSTKTDGLNNHISGGGNYRECSQEEFLQQQQQLSELKSSGLRMTAFCPSASSSSSSTISTIPRTTNITCGISFNTDKIVGGEDAGLGTWPWMVLFRARETNPFDGTVGDKSNWICGGVLITENFVLSAAHCFTNKLIEFVRIGEYDLINNPDTERSHTAPNPQDIFVECVIKHPEFGQHSEAGKRCRRCNDIALVKLEKPAKLHPFFVRPICLPLNPELELGFPVEEFQTQTQEGFATGWGITDIEDLHTVKGSDVLQQVNLNIVDRDFCLKRKTAYPNPNMIMCAGEGDGKDTCRADSGGPLMLHSKNGLSWYIVGITSFGPTVCGSQGGQTVFTSVHYYKDWIVQNINAHA